MFATKLQGASLFLLICLDLQDSARTGREDPSGRRNWASWSLYRSGRFAKPCQLATKNAATATTTYSPASCAPSSQLLRPSTEITVKMNVASATTATSNPVNTK